MARENLPRKPLVEAIFEVHWGMLPEEQGQFQRDPHYRLLLARTFDRLRSEYPEEEELPTAGIPDQLVGRSVQHRFRSARSAWPLVQMGPGLATLNETSSYTWDSFSRRVRSLIDVLYDAHPDPSAFKIERLLLRYFNAVRFNFGEVGGLARLREEMKVEYSLPPSLFDGRVSPEPQQLNWLTVYRSKNPAGEASIRFASGIHEGAESLVWEMQVGSQGADVPMMPERFTDWLENAHAVAEEWFFTIIAGPLE